MGSAFLDAQSWIACFCSVLRRFVAHERDINDDLANLTDAGVGSNAPRESMGSTAAGLFGDTALHGQQKRKSSFLDESAVRFLRMRLPCCISALVFRNRCPRATAFAPGCWRDMIVTDSCISQIRKKKAAMQRQSSLLQAADSAFRTSLSSRTSLSASSANSSCIASIDFSKQTDSTRAEEGAATDVDKESSRKELLRTSAVFGSLGSVTWCGGTATGGGAPVVFPPPVVFPVRPVSAQRADSVSAAKAGVCIEKRRDYLGKKSPLSGKSSRVSGSEAVFAAVAAGNAGKEAAQVGTHAHAFTDPLGVISGLPDFQGHFVGANTDIPTGRNRDSFVCDLVKMYAVDHDFQHQHLQAAAATPFIHVPSEQSAQSGQMHDQSSTSLTHILNLYTDGTHLGGAAFAPASASSLLGSWAGGSKSSRSAHLHPEQLNSDCILDHQWVFICART